MKIVKDRNIIEDWVNIPNSILVVPCNKVNKKDIYFGQTTNILRKFIVRRRIKYDKKF